MYQIANYDELYRPYNRSGEELRRADFVKLPVKPKGDGLQQLFEYKRGLEVFAIWCLLLEKATAENKPENRGKLLNHKEENASVEEIAKGISLRRKAPLVKYALSVLTTMGWVIQEPPAEQSSGEAEQIPTKLSKTKLSKTKLSKEYSSDFSIFWKKFKGRWNKEKGGYVKVGKWEAFCEFQELTTNEQQKAMAVADRAGGEFCPDACRWLKRKLFDDYRVLGPNQ